MKLLNIRPVSSFVKRAIILPRQRVYSISLASLPIRALGSFEQWRFQQTMASPTKVHLSTTDTGVVKIKPQDEEAAKVASSVLQKNHDVLPD